MRRIIGLGLAALALSGCATMRGTPPVAAIAGGDPQAVWEAGQAAYLKWNGARHGWTTTASGLQAHRDSAARRGAAHPTPGCMVTVNYEGRLINGGLFDSSFARHEPATFALGRVIKGWGEGVPMMRAGETWTFAIPAEIAYRDRAIRIDEPGKTSIFSRSTLIFRIELLSLGADCGKA